MRQRTATAARSTPAEPRRSAEDSRISINKTQSFAPAPEAVWTFHIGGYQVIDKYLKSRKGRTLSLDEINHVARIADTPAFTIEQMKKIDLADAQAFPGRGQSATLLASAIPVCDDRA